MKWSNWLIGACCALFVAVIVTPTGVYEGVWKLATGKDAAAWVQAIGSIVAIFASVLGAWWLQDRQRRLDAAAKADAEMEALLIVAISAHRAVEFLQNRSKSGDWDVLNAEVAAAALTAEIDAICSISLVNLPNRRARSKLNDLRVILVSARSLLSDIKSQLANGRRPPAEGFDDFARLSLEARDVLIRMSPERG